MEVAWTRPALRHLGAIADHIAQDSPAAAYRVARHLGTHTTELLSATPMIGRLGRAKATRELVFADLPYIVVYRVTEKVEILAVVHTARKWPKRFGHA